MKLHVHDIRKCDVCGKKFRYNDHYDEIGVKSLEINIDLALPDPPWTINYEDLCEDCWEKLIDYLENLKNSYKNGKKEETTKNQKNH